MAERGTAESGTGGLVAVIHVSLRPGVLDPAASAIHHALHGLGFDEVAAVRQAKRIELALAPGLERAAAERRVAEMCESLLANPVIESYRIEWAGA